MPQHIQQTNEKNNGIFVYLLLLTGLFILLEISAVIQGSEIYLGDFKLIADRIKIPAKVIPGIFYFVATQLFLHFIFTVFIWGMARCIAICLKFSWKTTETLSFTLWILGIITLLLANQYYFPNSKFAYLVSYMIHPMIGKYLFFFCSSIMGLALLLALGGFVLISPWGTLGITFLASLYFIYAWKSPPLKVSDAGTVGKPNIIVIGIDSLRPDFLGYFGYEKRTPHLDKFLNQATVFSDAITPIARTFPAWVSILSGQYPKQNGVRFNLPTLAHFDWQNTLPNILKKQGYETIFATDETRFSNIDYRFGFEKILAPPVGIDDFLLGNLNDFPMANLLVNTHWGKYLFPHSYGNRPVFLTYDPNTFIDFLQPALTKSRTKPWFFAVHFCLPHYPYFWGTHPANDKSIHNYQAAVKRIDQQFSDFIGLLQKANLLNHSIVIVLSDHGEAIELSGDRITEKELFIAGKENKKNIVPRFYPKSFDFETVNQSAGHGTDILSMTQYHTVLAFRMYGLTQNLKTAIPGQVSLLDIKPTILDYLHLSRPLQDNGYSLKNFILGEQSIVKRQNHFFMETDFSPQAVRSVHPETRQLLFEGIEYYQIDPKNGRITVKENMGKLIISSKQYADMYGEWILALYPQNKTKMTPILVNLQTGLWTNDLRTSFAKNSPAAMMLSALMQFYGNEITKVENI